MSFGHNLKILREEKQLSQRALGELLGISGKVIVYYETGKRFPQEVETYVKFANFFKVSVDWLFDRTEIRSFLKNGEHIISIDSEGLSSEDIEKIKEYASLLKNKNK